MQVYISNKSIHLADKLVPRLISFPKTEILVSGIWHVNTLYCKCVPTCLTAIRNAIQLQPVWQVEECVILSGSLTPTDRLTNYYHMMTSLKGDFSALLAICAGNSSVTAEFPSQWPLTRSFDVFFIRAWTNGWINNRDVGGLWRHRPHYDVPVMNNSEHDINNPGLPTSGCNIWDSAVF